MTDTATASSESKHKPQVCWGYQLIIDCFGCPHDACTDLNNGYEFLEEVCKFLNMTKQTQPYIFKTCERTYPGRPGYSGWVPIIESGIQIHTSAINNFVSVDIYSCRPFDRARVEEFTKQWFKSTEVESQFIYRGRDFHMHSLSGEIPAFLVQNVPDEKEAARLANEGKKKD